MAKITIEELSDSLKEHLNELGLTEEQVNSLVQNKLGDLSNLETVHKDNIVDSVNEVKDIAALAATTLFGSDMSNDTLMTDHKDSVIGAINEVFQRGNNVKQSLVEALIAKDIAASTSESFESLIGKLSSIEKLGEYYSIMNDKIMTNGYSFHPLSGDYGFAYSTTNGLYNSGDQFYKYDIVSLNEPIDFSAYEFIEITTNTSINSSITMKAIIAKESMNMTATTDFTTSNPDLFEYSSDAQSIDSATNVYTFDISSVADIGYLGVQYYLADTSKVYITDIRLIKKASNIECGDIGYATGDGSITFIVTSSESKTRNAILDKPFGFTPTHIILVFDNGAILTNKTTSDNPLVLDEENYVYIDSMTSDTLTFNSFSGMRQYSHDFTYYAFNADSSSSGSGTGPNILSYETLELSSSDLFIPTNSGSDYYHYSLESYNDDDVYLVFADTKAMEDDIGYMQYYNSIYFYPDASAAQGSILLGYKGGDSTDRVTEMSAHARIPIMKTTDRLLENKLVVLYRAGAVSNAFSQSLLNTEPANYQLVDYRTFNLDSLSFDFDYILFSLSVNNGDGDSSTIYSMYDRNSKKCCIIAYGYDTYSYKIDDVPSNAIPIFPTNRYSGLFVSYTGFVKNGNNIE